ncbi:MAG: hypothetical protein RSE41_06975 [Clostridia bacterium]
MNDFDALFSPTVDIEDKKRVIEDYKPSADKGKGGIYKSIVRFVPWYQNPSQSIINKWSCWLVDPVSGKGKTVDCPSSVGEPSPIRDMFFQLRNSKSVAQQEQSKVFSSRQTFSALVQIIKDENAPELEGKILRYTFGKKIQEKIIAAMKPEFGEPINPFDIFNGAPFAFVITKVMDFNNYDKCAFMNQPCALQWVDENGKMTPMTQKDDKLKILEFLKENSADLSKYAYHPWDDETKNFVNTVIAAVTGHAQQSFNTASVMNQANNGFVSSTVITQPTETFNPSNNPSTDISSENAFGDISELLNDTVTSGSFDDLPF